MESPFRVGGEVEPPYFVGREAELKKLSTDLIGLSQNYLILAPRRFGKTCLLHNLRKQVEKEKKLLVPRVNCMELTNYVDFYEHTVSALLQEYSRKSRFKGTLKKFQKVFKDKLLASAKALSEIGGSIEAVGEAYLKFRESELDDKALVGEAFKFFGSLAKEEDFKIVFLLDEFQEIATFNGHIFKQFKANMDRFPNVRFFFSGSSVQLLSSIFLKPNSPLYLMVARHFMEPLGPAESTDFVTTRLAAAKVNISEADARNIYELTGGIPFYLQKLGLMVFQHALLNKKDTLSTKDIEKTFALMLDELSSEFEVRWMDRFSTLQKQIVRALALKGIARSSEIAEFIGTGNPNISAPLTRLHDMMIVSKLERGVYKLTDIVFDAWLKGKL